METAYSLHSVPFAVPVRGLEPSGPKGMASITADFGPSSVLIQGFDLSSAERSKCAAQRTSRLPASMPRTDFGQEFFQI